MENLYQILQAHKTEIKDIVNGGNLALKAAGVMLESTNVTGAGIDELNPQFAGYSSIKATDKAQLLDYFPKVFVNSHSLVFADEVSPDGGVTAIGEGVVKPLSDSDFNATSPTMTKYAGLITISDEMLSDIPFVESAISEKLVKQVKDKIMDAWFVSASGTLQDANILTAGTGGTKQMDCLVAIYSDMKTRLGYSPNLFLMNSPDYAKTWIEDAPSENWLSYSNIDFIPNSGVNRGYLMALDTTMFPFYVYKDISIEFGKVGNDFKYNRTSVRCEARVAYNFGRNNRLAGYYDTILATKAAIL